MARSKLTPAVHDAIVKLVGNGAFIERACDEVGISERTFYGWIKRGEDPDETDPRYLRFLQATTRARAAFENRTLNVVVQAAPTDWRGAAWLLERLFPTRYSNMRKVELTGAGGGPVTIATLASLEGMMCLDEPEGDDD
jgi:hypothetical protein